MSHEHVLLVGDVQQLFRHLLQPLVRLRAFLLQVLRVGLRGSQLGLGELALVSLLLKPARPFLRQLHPTAELPVVAHVPFHLLHSVPEPVPFVLRGVDPLLQRGNLLRRRRRLANAIERLFLYVVELPRHLRVPLSRLPALVVALLPRGVEHPLHLRERRARPGIGRRLRAGSGRRFRRLSDRRRRSRRRLRRRELRPQRRHLPVRARQLRPGVVEIPLDLVGVRASLERLQARELLTKRRRLRLYRVPLRGHLLERIPRAHRRRRVRLRAHEVPLQVLDLSFLRVARLREELVVVLGHRTVLGERLGQLLLQPGVPGAEVDDVVVRVGRAGSGVARRRVCHRAAAAAAGWLMRRG